MPKLFRILNIIDSSINHKDFYIFLPTDPFFMSIMNFLEILYRNSLLALSISLFDSFMANLRITFKIDNSFKGRINHQCFTYTAIDIEFRCVHISLIFHDFPKDKAICHRRTFGKMSLLRFLLECLVPKQSTRV